MKPLTGAAEKSHDTTRPKHALKRDCVFGMHNASAKGKLHQEHVKEKADQLQQLSLGN